MIAWLIGQGTKTVVTAFGGSKDSARLASIATSFLASPFDPVGFLVNGAHLGSEALAEDGSKLGQVANAALSTTLVATSAANQIKLPSQPGT
jgi:hypothetical protein